MAGTIAIGRTLGRFLFAACLLLAAAAADAQQSPVLLGVNIREVGSPETSGMGVVSDSGAVITKVFTGYAAEHAGLRVGDVVVAVGDQPVNACGDLYRIIGASRVGDRLSFTIHRGPSSQRIEVALGATANPKPNEAREIYLGVRLRSASHPDAKALGIDSPTGAVLMHVTPDGPAAQAGFQRGDHLVEFAGHEILVYEDLEAVARGCPFGSRQRVVFLRGLDRLETQIVIGSRTLATAPVVYVHPSEEFRLVLPRGWTYLQADPAPQPQQHTHDTIQSTEGAYQFHIDRRVWDAPNASEALDSFARLSLGESAQARSGRLTVSEAPAVFVGSPYGRNPRVIRYRISWVHGPRRYVMDAFGPGFCNAAKLPLAVSELLTTINFTKSYPPPSVVVAPGPPPLPTVAPPPMQVAGPPAGPPAPVADPPASDDAAGTENEDATVDQGSAITSSGYFPDAESLEQETAALRAAVTEIQEAFEAKDTPAVVALTHPSVRTRYRAMYDAHAAELDRIAKVLATRRLVVVSSKIAEYEITDDGRRFRITFEKCDGKWMLSGL